MKKYTDEETEALTEKEMYPSKDVICPRCGKLLEFTDGGNWFIVRCPTKGCISETGRGL